MSQADYAIVYFSNLSKRISMRNVSKILLFLSVLTCSDAHLAHGQDQDALQTGLSFFREREVYACTGVVKEVVPAEQKVENQDNRAGDSIRYFVGRDGERRYCEEVELGYDERREALFQDGRAIVVEDYPSDGGRGVGLASAAEDSGLLVWRKRLGYVGILFGYFYWETLTLSELFNRDGEGVISELPSQPGIRVFQSASKYGVCKLWLTEANGFRPMKIETLKGPGDRFGQATDGTHMVLGSGHGWGFNKVVGTVENFRFDTIDGEVLLIGATATVQQLAGAGDGEPLSFSIGVEDMRLGKEAVLDVKFALRTPIANGTGVNMLDGEKGVFYAWEDGKVVVDFSKKPLAVRRPSGVFASGNTRLFLALNLLILTLVGAWLLLKAKRLR